MSESKYFTWDSDACFARNGIHLIRGKSYKMNDFDPPVVKEWIRSGAAKEGQPGSSKSKEEK